MDFSDMTAEQILELIGQLEGEVGRRQTVEALELELVAPLQAARDAGAAKTPHPREQFEYPSDVTKAYTYGETVVEQGQTYESHLPVNLCHPRHCKTGWHKIEPQPDDDHDGDGDQS